MNNEILGVFKPKFYSLRNLIIILIVLLLLLPPEILIGFSIVIAIKNGVSVYIISFLGVIVTIILIGYLIYLMFSYRRMCYTLYKDRLILRCGVFKSIIFYSQIKKVYEEASLDYMALFKGGIFSENYALGPIYFWNYGWITLYTTSSKNVIVIKTEKKKYGVTPTEPERFLSELIRLRECDDHREWETIKKE